MNSELNKRLEIIKKELLVSKGAFIIIANYLRSLGRDLFMINNSLEDDCSTISRSITDSWLCQIESQLDGQLTAFGISGKRAWSELFMSHPPLEKRIAALQQR